MDKSYDYLNNILNDNDTLIMATSTGPDSMCLFHMLQNLEKKVNIICAHVNHKVRKESDDEYSFLESYCKDRDIVFEGVIFNNRNGNFESNARKFRYEFLYKLKGKYNARYILTAHHGDDEIETILMRITRGSNLSGYSGIKLLDKDFLRPLLFTTKNEILKYCENNNIKYFLDKTNEENDHTRNRYRHEVLPFLKRENNLVHEKYLQFSNELQEYDVFVNDYIYNKDIIENGIINLKKVLDEKDFIIKKSIELLIKDIQAKDYLEVSNESLKNLVNLIKSDKSNARISLNNEYVGIKTYDKFYIDKLINNESFYEVFDTYFENKYYVIDKVSNSEDTSNFVIRLNSDEIKLPLIIRNRENSDVMEIKNSGHKKVKDILIDEKIDLLMRDVIPMVFDSSGNLLWIPGIKKSKFDKSKKEKYDIILTSERKN